HVRLQIEHLRRGRGDGGIRARRRGRQHRRELHRARRGCRDEVLAERRRLGRWWHEVLTELRWRSGVWPDRRRSERSRLGCEARCVGRCRWKRTGRSRECAAWRKRRRCTWWECATRRWTWRECAAR